MERSLIALGWSHPRNKPRRQRRLRIEPLEGRHLLTASALPPSALSLPDAALDEREHRAGSLIVQFKSGATTPGSLAAHLLTADLGPEWSLTPGMRRVDLSSSADLTAALLAFKQDPNVAFVEPDYRVSIQIQPSDPGFPSQYGLQNTGQSGGLADADIDATEAWDITTGDPDTIVAVIDTGVDYRHPDLAANMWTNRGEIPGNNIDDDHNGYIDDVHGYDFVNHDGDPMDDNFHGTHVAGIIGAVGDNGLGVTGVNWHVRIMALKFLDANGGGFESDAIAALNYAVDNGAVVSNNSWGGIGFSQAFQLAIENAAEHNHIFVAAAGNDSSNNDTLPFFPASYDEPNVIAVAATDRNDNLAYFSNYGANTVDLSAPGVDILSTFPTEVTAAMREKGFEPNYGTISGTSMAAPHVTGVVALIQALNPDLPYDDVIDRISSTVDVIPDLPTITSGRVNAAAAVDNPAPDTTGPRIIGTEPAAVVYGSFDHIRLRFSEAIDPATLTLEDIESFAGTAGEIPVISIVPVPNSSRLFDVTFAPQAAIGDYALVIGPNIADKAGNLMNQDGDSQFGEPTEDQYTARITVKEGSHFESAQVPLIIPGFTISASAIVIDQNIVIGDLDVNLNLTYPDVADLILVLVSPQNIATSLSFFDGDIGEGFINTTFDDEATQSIAAGASPYSGSFRPNDPLAGVSQVLAQFDGESARGVWWLFVENFAFTDSIGQLNSWSLDIKAAASGQPPDGNQPPTANNDTISMTTGGPLTFGAGVLLANDSDPDGDLISLIGVQSGSGGFAELNTDGTITFTPQQDFVGTAGFSYVISDGYTTATAQVTVNVEAQTLWHNRSLSFDVDADGQVTATDVVTVINTINAVGATSLLGLSGIFKPTIYLDVTADNYVGPDDVLAIINYINDSAAHPSSTIASQSVPAATTNDATSIDAALLSLLTDTPTKKK